MWRLSTNTCEHWIKYPNTALQYPFNPHYIALYIALQYTLQCRVCIKVHCPHILQTQEARLGFSPLLPLAPSLPPPLHCNHHHHHLHRYHHSNHHHHHLHRYHHSNHHHHHHHHLMPLKECFFKTPALSNFKSGFARIGREKAPPDNWFKSEAAIRGIAILIRLKQTQWHAIQFNPSFF